MSSSRGRGQRSARTGKTSRPKPKAKRKKSKKITVTDHRFVTPSKIPVGATRGDISRQVFCCGPPHHYYLDIKRMCVQCDQQFVFTASEQQYWYETLQFRVDSTAIRCQPCRKQRRTAKAIDARVQKASALASSDKPEELIEYATALIESIERLGTGKVSKVVTAARRAYKLDSSWPEPLYWLARAHEVAGRPARAAETYEKFLAHPASDVAARRLKRHASERLAAVSQQKQAVR